MLSDYYTPCLILIHLLKSWREMPASGIWSLQLFIWS